MRGEEFHRRFAESTRSRDQLLSEVLAALSVKARQIGFRLGVTDPAEQADVAHDTIVWLLEGGHDRLDAGRDIYGYLYRIMHNAFVDRLRKRKCIVNLDESDDEDGPAADRHALQDGRFTTLVLSLDATCLGKVYAALSREPASGKGVRLVDLINYLANADEPSDSRALAAFFGTTPGASRQRKSSALARLRQACQQQCGDDTCRG